MNVDLCEKNIHSSGGAKCFLFFRDCWTYFRTLYFLKKREAPGKLKTFLKLVENQFNIKVKVLRSENGTEIKILRTQQTLDNLGIFHSTSRTHTPQQNERRALGGQLPFRINIHCLRLSAFRPDSWFARQTLLCVDVLLGLFNFPVSALSAGAFLVASKESSLN